MMDSSGRACACVPRVCRAGGGEAEARRRRGDGVQRRGRRARGRGQDEAAQAQLGCRAAGKARLRGCAALATWQGQRDETRRSKTKAGQSDGGRAWQKQRRSRRGLNVVGDGATAMRRRDKQGQGSG